MQEDEVTSLLSQAVALLRIIARPQMVELRERFEAAMLTTAKRGEMWAAMDGSRSLSVIARQVGTSQEAVRQFLMQVQTKWPDVVEVKTVGAAIFPRRLI